MQLSELSARLDNLLLEKEGQGILDVLSILIEISATEELKNDLRVVKGSYHIEKRKSNTEQIAPEEFKRQTAKVLSTIYSLLYHQDDQWIAPDWENHEAVINLKPIDQDLDLDAIEATAEYEAIDHDDFERDVDNEIALPKHPTILPDSAQSPLTEEEKKQYRRQVNLLQDRIRYGDYDGAYTTACLVAEELEGESIQLRELLLVSLFKKTGVQEIVRNYLEGTGEYFLKLKLHAEKIANLSQFDSGVAKANRSKSGKATGSLQATPTAALNIRLICRLLINEIRHIYQEKRFNGRKFDYLEQQETLEIRMYYSRLIQITMGIYSLHPMPTFFGTLMLELSGGGYLDWLRVDKNMKVVDRENQRFSALHYRRLLSEKYAPIIFPGKEKEVFNQQAAYILLKVLRSKYVNIKKSRYRDRDGKTDWSLTWNAHYKSLQSFLTGYALYEDERFLEKPLRELSGRAGMDWIDLDENGELYTHKHCNNYLRKFDPVVQLKVLAARTQPNNPEAMMNDVVKFIASKKLKAMKEDYQRIPSALTYLKHRNEIKEIIRFISICKVCYSLTNNPEFIRFALNILSDTQKITWHSSIFLYDRMIHSNASFCLPLRFDALLEFRHLELLNKSQATSADLEAEYVESGLNGILMETIPQPDSTIENLSDSAT